MSQHRRAARARGTRWSPGWWATAALVAGWIGAGCGEVYSDLDVTTQATTTAVFVPASLPPNSVRLLEIRARFDAVGTAWVDSTSLDGTQGIAMAFPELGLGFTPGPCPDATEVTEDLAEDIAAQLDDALDEQGRYTFCGAVRVGDVEPGVVSVSVLFWNGLESVTGEGDLAIVDSL